MNISFLNNAILLQVECNPYLTQKKLISFCKSRGIIVTGYSPMGSPDSPYFKVGMPRLLEDPKLKEVAQLVGKSVGQVVLRYLVSDTGFVLAVQPLCRFRLRLHVLLST